MKNVKFTLFIIVAAFFTACSKNQVFEDTLVQSLSDANTVSATQVSPWLSGLSWNRADSSDYMVFASSFNEPRLTQEVLQDGAVIVFVKNIFLDDNRRADKPIRIPFHVLSDMSRPGYDQVWYNVNQPGSVMVKYRTNKHKFGADVQVPDQQVEVKYFVITPDDLERLGHTPASITRLSYGELVSVFGNEP